MPEKFLPIGTVCLLKDSTQMVAITGFCMKNESVPDKTFDYVACYYPQGVFDQNKNILFDHDQIVKILYMGFINEEERLFKQKVKEILASQVDDSQKEFDPEVYDMNTPVATFVSEE